jgi:hypothetical protein
MFEDFVSFCFIYAPLSSAADILISSAQSAVKIRSIARARAKKKRTVSRAA